MSDHIAAVPLVTVVVPAYNAERTIDATLCSIRSQTYRNLEIIVVDDGSSDSTVDIIARHAVDDARLHLITQPNAGVAAARNSGIAAAKGVFVAPVDADDLCAPTRIEKQVEAMIMGGPRAGLAYTWSAQIDENDRILDASFKPNYTGDVVDVLRRFNFVANGSAALMRTDAIRLIGGYDSSLRARGAQGCEDWDILLRLALEYEFALVPEFSTGYRQSASNMSSNSLKMLRSFELVAAAHTARFPLARSALREGRKNMIAWLIDIAARDRRHGSVLALAPRLAISSPRWLYRILAVHYWSSDIRPVAPTEGRMATDLAGPVAGEIFPIGVPEDISSVQRKTG